MALSTTSQYPEAEDEFAKELERAYCRVLAHKMLKAKKDHDKTFERLRPGFEIVIAGGSVTEALKVVRMTRTDFYHRLRVYGIKTKVNGNVIKSIAVKLANKKNREETIRYMAGCDCLTCREALKSFKYMDDRGRL